MVVVETYNHELLLQDSNGNQWCMYVEDNDWFVGDGASLIIYDNGTQTIYDDVIVDIKYLNLGGLIND